ncbi:MAG: hypothetical protein HQL10_00685 [Nitrospirae bacterium]|nr:hypothetical protein [Nitrospirota bacterium]
MYRILTLGLLLGLLVNLNSEALFAAQEPSAAPQSPASNIIKNPVQPIQLQPVQTQPVQLQPVQLQPTIQEPLTVEPLQQPQMPAAPQAETKQSTLKKGQVSFHFDDADIFSVIQTIFGDILKVNYLIDSKVSGKVNFRSVAPISKEDVLPLMQIILRLNGIGIVEDGGLYRIIPIADIAREPSPLGLGREYEKVKIIGKALIQVIPVKYIQSIELVKILTPFLSANALIIDVTKSNHVIIADTDANIKRLLHLVDIFDNESAKKTNPQVFVYPVQNSKAKDVANILQQIFLGAKSSTPQTATTTSTTTTKQPVATVPQQPQVTGIPKGGETIVSDITKIFADDVTNALIVLATPEDYKTIEETIKKIDILPRQVMIEALIAEVTLTDDLKFGIEWSLRGNIRMDAFSKLKVNTETGFNQGNLGTVTSTTGLSEFAFIAKDAAGVVRNLIHTLATENRVNILASPHILALDNRESRIQIGDQVPILTSLTTATTGTGVSPTQTSSIQYKDVGIISKVKPQINESGLVTLDIALEVSDYSLITIMGGAQVAVSKREVNTNLVTKDGETIVIGGLIREDKKPDSAGIPYLSKIPILGYLFGYKHKYEQRKELLMLITTHVIKSQQDAQDVSSGYLNRTKQINKKDLQKSLAPVEKESATESNGK